MIDNRHVFDEFDALMSQAGVFVHDYEIPEDKKIDVAYLLHKLGYRNPE